MTQKIHKENHMTNCQRIQKLFDEKGKPLGVFIRADLWDEVKDKFKDLLGTESSEKDKEIKEPLKDWEFFKKSWDFKYPYDFSIECKNCGQITKNWEQDKEKKFLLTAANISGLVSFRCLRCGSKIIKKHFKDKIVSETIPQSQKKE